jgi:hypothetical protein
MIVVCKVDIYLQESFKTAQQKEKRKAKATREANTERLKGKSIKMSSILGLGSCLLHVD